MKNIWKNYKSSLILIMSIIIGAIVGIVWGSDAKVLSPFGDLFLNLLFVIIVPLIFLTISTSIAKMTEPKRLSKIMRSIILVFIITSLVAVLVGLLTTHITPLVETKDSNKILSSLKLDESGEKLELNILERTVEAISVNDFSGILTKNNILAIVVFSILFGLSIRKSGKKGEKALEILNSFQEIVMNFVNIIMYYAPIGLGCYFASLIGNYGASIAVGYLKTFIIYTIVSILFYFIVYTIYAYIAAGTNGVKRFWTNIIPATLTSLSTCSSAACIPVNVETAKNIGVSNDIAETTIPLGTSFHKDGSIIGSVFKIMFLVYLFGTSTTGTIGFGKILIVALLANLLITAVPIGGGTISETLIISMLGYPMGALPILTVIATIIDAPATVLNVVGDDASSMLVSRIVDGKDWINKKNKK